MHFGVAGIKRTNKRNFIANLVKTNIVFTLILLFFAFFIFMNNFGENKIASAEPSESEEKDIEEQLKDTVSDVLNDIDFSDIEDVFVATGETFFNGKTFKEYVAGVVSGEEDLDFQAVWQMLKVVLKNNIKNILSPLLIVLCISLLCVLFQNVQSNKISGVQEVVRLICFSVIVVIVSTLIARLVSDARESIEKMQKSMNAIFPILLVLMTSIGGVASARAYTPLVAILSNIVSSVFVYVLLPLFSLSLVLSILGHISSNTRLEKLNQFTKSLFKWIVGVVCTVFIGYLAIKGFTAGSTDGISLKATKYAIKNYVPILGGYISDGFELVKAGSLIVKNAIGFVSCLLLAVICLFPVLSIAICELGLKLVAGIIEPVGDSKTSNLLSSISGSLKLLVSVVIGVSIMYFLTIYLVTCTVFNIF